MKKNNQFSNLDAIKRSLDNAENFQDVKNNPAVKSTIISIIKSIPLIGELIDSTMDACIMSFQEKKRIELIEMILSDVVITSDMVNDIEFIFNFAKTIEAVDRLSANDKVKYFANLIKNGYFKSEKIHNDEFEEFLRILSMLSFREIDYLFFLYKYQEEHMGKDRIKGGYFNKFGEEFAERFNCDKFDYLDKYDRLASTGCVRRAYAAYPSKIVKVQDGSFEDYQMSDMDVDIDYYYINDDFIKFIKTISDKED